jgi:superfamily I DNA/RNA helicase
VSRSARSGADATNSARDLLETHVERPLSAALLSRVFESAARESLLRAFDAGYPALLRWWTHHLEPEFRSRSAFPVDVALRLGPTGLVEKPGVTVGTIHSVKGGEADVVYLFPDLSKAADEQYQRGGDYRDAVIRVFYVGATRARETLYICSPESANAISI